MNFVPRLFPRQFYLTILLTAIGLSTFISCQETKQESPPNVVLFFLDDGAYDDFAR